ncbi:MAG: methylenetetrahydrofolate reductase [NAD(P)H] [Planctomycetes bacterium]|jgi:methylenetetrahydrofolate reductase (NADPH)|nr:methylenetetrahydrofolate reductase [NAD(P)H] [Planctomycetota bacterium]
MHIQDIFENHPTTFSFEFFPPKTPESSQRLFDNIRKLEALRPAFVDVTYGAGGGTRELTNEVVLRIQKETGIETVPHLTCVCHQQEEIDQILETWAEANVGTILALSGDIPRDKPDWDRTQDAFRYAADLVKHIKNFKGHRDPRGFGIGVAGFPEGHPETPNRLQEIEFLKAKVDAGADYICTQLFFDNRDFYDYRERCELAGIDVPILAGLMPVTSAKGMAKMAELAAGSRFPAALLRAIERCNGDEEAVKRVGIHWATEQCRDLLDNQVRGIHFYTLNQSDATRRIYENLGVPHSTALQPK